MSETATTIRCECGAEREAKPTAEGTPALPRGWKRAQGRVWCQKCWGAGWVMRAVTVPVAEPINCTREELNETLRRCWVNSTRLANWAVDDLYLADVRRKPDDGPKMPKMPKRYQYPGARAECPDMDPQSVTSLLRDVEGKYRAKRYNVVWTRSESLPNHRYPYPYPVHNQSWHAYRTADNDCAVSVRLGGQRLELRLAATRRRQRQRTAVDRLIDGELIAGTLTIYRQRAGGDHAAAPTDRGNGGRAKVRYRTMVKMALWMPKRDPRPAEGTLSVWSGPEGLLHYRIGDAPVRHVYAEQLPRLVAQRARRQERLRHDSKAEKRRPRKEMSGIRDQQESVAVKIGRAINAALHEASASIANYAERQRCAVVAYDDHDQTFVPSLPWYRLREMLSQKLDERRIEMRHVGTEAPTEPVDK